jgi:hypothetical protein
MESTLEGNGERSDRLGAQDAASGAGKSPKRDGMDNGMQEKEEIKNRALQHLPASNFRPELRDAHGKTAKTQKAQASKSSQEKRQEIAEDKNEPCARYCVDSGSGQ